MVDDDVDLRRGSDAFSRSNCASAVRREDRFIGSAAPASRASPMFHYASFCPGHVQPDSRQGNSAYPEPVIREAWPWQEDTRSTSCGCAQ